MSFPWQYASLLYKSRVPEGATSFCRPEDGLVSSLASARGPRYSSSSLFCWYLGSRQGDADEPDVEVVNACLEDQQQLLAPGHVVVGLLEPGFFLLQHVLYLQLNGLKAVECEGKHSRESGTAPRARGRPGSQVCSWVLC